MKNIALDGEEYLSSTIVASLIGAPNGLAPLDASGLIPSALLVGRAATGTSATATGVGGAIGIGGTVIAESLTQSVIASGLFSYANVSPYGSNGGQRNMYIDSLSQVSTNTKIIVGIDSTYEEDIEFHVVVAVEG